MIPLNLYVNLFRENAKPLRLDALIERSLCTRPQRATPELQHDVPN